MENKDFIISAESVSEGHPDKLADQISDGVLDAIISQDPNAHVACETFTTTGTIVVGGEIKTNCYVNIPQIARNVVLDVGYDNPKYGLDGNSCGVHILVDEQSADIDQGVMEGKGLNSEQGAGDQGIMYGYACNDTDSLMPLPIHLSHKLVYEAAKVRKNNGGAKYLRPDSKSQVTVRYENWKPVEITDVVMSHQHHPEVTHAKLKEYLVEEVIKPNLPKNIDISKVKYHINPTGRFVIGGPHGDTGLTGRKIIVDTYGGFPGSNHGGGAFSGKDPSKVDRSACYMARHIAKNFVAAGFADKMSVQLAYAIGEAQPISIYVDAMRTSKLPETEIAKLIREYWDLTPKGIIEFLNLKRPIYRETSTYGHFGRNIFPWEKLDMVEKIKKHL
jgi:S-adenosylmethionine synthetase